MGTVLQTSHQLFPHPCVPEDMRFCSYNPQTISFYCVECGGRLTLAVTRDEWALFFGHDSLVLTERALERVVPSTSSDD